MVLHSGITPAWIGESHKVQWTEPRLAACKADAQLHYCFIPINSKSSKIVVNVYAMKAI